MKTVAVLSGLVVLAALGCQQTKSTQGADQITRAPLAQKPIAVEPAPEPAPQPKYASFGAPAKLADSESIPVEKMMASPDEIKGKYVRLTGTVDKVCPRKG